jgi:hypothetical protein
MVSFLMARGADPHQKLPFDQGKTVIAFATRMHSPLLPLLDPPSPPAVPAPALAKADTGAPLRRDAGGTGEVRPLRAAALAAGETTTPR